MRPIGGDTEAFIASFTDDAYLVDYNGTGDIVFALEGDRIKRMIIS